MDFIDNLAIWLSRIGIIILGVDVVITIVLQLCNIDMTTLRLLATYPLTIKTAFCGLLLVVVANVIVKIKYGRK